MQIRKFLVSIFVVIVAFFLGYGDAIGLIQQNAESAISKAISFFSTKGQEASKPSTTDQKSPQNTTSPTNAAAKTAKTGSVKPSLMGLNDVKDQVPPKQQQKHNKYLDDLRERLRQSQEEPSSEDDQGVMVNDEDSTADDVEELPPAFADPYAQFRRPPGERQDDQPSTFIPEDNSEEVLEDGSTVEEVPPDIEEQVDIVPDEDGNN